jgi:hypothetical protein
MSISSQYVCIPRRSNMSNTNDIMKQSIQAYRGNTLSLNTQLRMRWNCLKSTFYFRDQVQEMTRGKWRHRQWCCCCCCIGICCTCCVCCACAVCASTDSDLMWSCAWDADWGAIVIILDFMSGASLLPDVLQTLSSRFLFCFLSLARLFWNQILTCRSESPIDRASSALRCIVIYLL